MDATPTVLHAACRLYAAALLVLLFQACSTSPLEGDGVRVRFDFTDGEPDGWTGAFADYPDDGGTDYEFDFGVRDLPAELGSGKGLLLASHNRSDDVFMFLKRRITGLAPETTYRLTVTVELASNAPSGCVGIGGAPGESVYLKAGAAAVEPVVVEVDGFHTVNVDKGQQSAGGRDAVVIGDVANGDACEGEARYRLVERATAQPLEVTTDPEGALWLFVGTDSGFEGLTELYFTRIEVLLR